MTTLDGRRILITGGSSGIGAALASVCVGLGAKVGLIARSQDRLDEVASATGAAAVAADISDPRGAAEAVDAVAAQLGGLDGLVNNAGIMLHSRLPAGYVDDWIEMFQINVLGTMFVINAALPYLREAAFADIVNVASVSADGARAPDFSIYAATKAAIMRISEGLQQELEAEDIRVSAIKPAHTKTPGFGPGIRDEHVRQDVLDTIEAIGMQPETVATQIAHLMAMDRGAIIPQMTLLPYNPDSAKS